MLKELLWYASHKLQEIKKQYNDHQTENKIVQNLWEAPFHWTIKVSEVPTNNTEKQEAIKRYQEETDMFNPYKKTERKERKQY